jgi:methylmalonyl-CoA/ethylmalonyl-CoA epimerase
MTEIKAHESIVSIEGKKIDQIGIMVDDVARVVVEMSRLFGLGPWTIIDVLPTELIFRDQFVGAGPYVQRIASADLAGLQIELIEPLYGPGPHVEFLEKHGQAIQHFSFGEVNDYDEMLEGLKKAGFSIEFQGLLKGFARATYMDTLEDLGTVMEFTKPLPADSAPTGAQAGVVPVGTYAPLGPPLIDMKGKKIVRIAIVVVDVEKTAGRYQEVLGVGPWTFTDKTATDVVLHGRALRNMSFSLRSAVAEFGELQIELIQPLCGPSLYMEFLGIRGNGIHHLNFGFVDDADAMATAMRKEGYDIEMQGIMSGDTQFTCMSTQKKLGGIFAFEKRIRRRTTG